MAVAVLVQETAAASEVEEMRHRAAAAVAHLAETPEKGFAADIVGAMQTVAAYDCPGPDLPGNLAAVDAALGEDSAADEERTAVAPVPPEQTEMPVAGVALRNRAGLVVEQELHSSPFDHDAM